MGIESWPDTLDREAVWPALAAFVEVVGDNADYELIITSDFENQVKARLEPGYAEVFTQDRGAYGTAMAKTLRQDDGRSVVVFDVRLFAKGAAPPDAMFRHEALHVLLNRSAENAFDSRNALAGRSAVDPDLVAMAGIAAEEYRVQRAVYERYPDDPWASFEALCEAGHNAINRAAVDYYWDPLKDVELVRNAVMTAFSAMTTQAGYVAAQFEVAALPTPSLTNRALHERMLSKPWDAVVTELRKLPGADQRISRPELDTSILRIAALLDDWLEQLGFRTEVLDDGTLFFHVYEHEDWVRRGPVRTEPGTA